LFFKSSKNYEIWKKSIDLISRVHQISKQLPRTEQYGLSEKMCRSALAVASNIGEGASKSSRSDLIRSLLSAKGSLGELYTQFKVSQKLGFLEDKKDTDISPCILEIDHMINSLIRTSQNK